VRTIHDEEVEAMGVDRMRSIVELELRDGGVISRFADTARGTPEKPLKNQELDEKFTECASFVLDESRTNNVLEMIRQIEEIPRIKELTSLLAGG
jgi:2-methylcitrate dehydratase PrpD